MADRAHLGHAVALDGLAADARGAGRGELGPERRRPGQHEVERGEIEALDRRVLGEREHHRRRDEELAHAVGLDQPQRRLEVEARQRHLHAAEREVEVHQHGHAVDVEIRQEGQRRVAGSDVEHPLDLQHVGDEVAVGEHHALGQPGGARGIREGDHVGRGVDRRLRPQRRAEQRVERRGAVGGADHRDLGHPGPLGAGPRGFEQGGDGHQQLGAGVAQLVAHLVGGVAGVQRGDRAAGPGDGVERLDEPGQVRGHDRDDMAGSDAARGEPAGQPLDPVAQLGPGDDAPGRAFDDRGLVRTAREAAEDQFGDRDIRNRHVRERAAVNGHAFPPVFREGSTNAVTDIARPAGRVGRRAPEVS